MANDREFVAFIAEQMSSDFPVSYRAMFGGYCLYCNEKVVALVGDGRLYFKATDAGKAFIGDYTEAPAYEGAKPSLLIEDHLDDRQWLSELTQITEKALPKPRPKKSKTK